MDETPPVEPRLARVRRIVVGNAWLGLVAAAALVALQAVDFEPPEQVRVRAADAGSLVGEAPPQAFSPSLDNPQALQLRATLRLYPDATTDLSAPDPELMEAGRLLSQPVVTTIYGMNATMNQTIRLEGGDLEVDLSVETTPRLAHEPRKGKAAPPVVLEHALTVRSRRSVWYRPEVQSRVHLNSSGFLTKVEEHGHRVVFTVDEHLFSLDLELHRPGVVSTPTLSSSG